MLLNFMSNSSESIWTVIKMGFFYFTSLPFLALANPIVGTLSIEVQPKQTINGTVEYSTECKSCPYSLCTNVNIPWYEENVTLTCWAK
jgi:hypothetical protein